MRSILSVAVLTIVLTAVGQTRSAELSSFQTNGGSPNAPSGQADAIEAGKAVWQDAQCRNCHGVQGEGAFGPDLAGRGLTVQQFTRAVRKPWGVMPAFDERNISDEEIARVAAYLASLPPRSATGPWRTAVPQNAKAGQALMISDAGCGQCHGPVMANPRTTMGGINPDFEWFKGIVYGHTTTLAGRGRLHMGNFSRDRLPESLLRDIWQYISVDAGFRVPIRAQVGPAQQAGQNLTYAVTVSNGGTAGKGLTAEDVTLLLEMPPGATVVSAGGAGYQGLRHDAKENVDSAVWQIPRLGPSEKQSFTLTFLAASAGLSQGTVRWEKPRLGDGATDQIAVTVLSPPQTR